MEKEIIIVDDGSTDGKNKLIIFSVMWVFQSIFEAEV